MGSLLLPGLMDSLMYTFLLFYMGNKLFCWTGQIIKICSSWGIKFLKQRRRQDGSAPTANPYGPMSGQVMVATKECWAGSIGVAHTRGYIHGYCMNIYVDII